MNKYKDPQSSNSPVDIQRRSFLRKGGMITMGVGMIAVSGGLVAPEAWASKAVGKHASKTLLRMGRDIYPHDRVEDKYYALVLVPMAEQAEKDAGLKKLLTNGVKQLDAVSQKRHSKNYLAIKDAGEREAVLREIQTTAFFAKIKGGLMMGIYNNKELWPRFDYGGSSWEKGGYKNRGFDADLAWLK